MQMRNVEWPDQMAGDIGMLTVNVSFTRHRLPTSFMTL